MQIHRLSFSRKLYVQSLYVLILSLSSFFHATPVSAQPNTVYLPFISQASTPVAVPVRSAKCENLNQKEISLSGLIQNYGGQQRPFMVCNSILASTARQKAMDLANRDYFNHTDPDGVGPNSLIRSAGYPLPGFYSHDRDGNNVESLAAGYTTAQEAFNAWLESNSHRTHVLGEIEFYAEQVEFGIGYTYLENSTYRHYWVFHSAYSEDPQ